MNEVNETQLSNASSAPKMAPEKHPKTLFRAGFVALVGQPNAGKSTLLNAILEEKVSIVSDKPQTTRRRVTGILNLPEAQVIFVDAPGTLKSKTGINGFLRDEVTDCIAKADVVCALLDADASEDSVKELIGLLKRSKKPWVAAITKSDLMGGTRTPRYFELLLEERIPFVSISGLKRPEEAKTEILNRVVPLLPEAKSALYDEDIYTTQTLRQMAAEFVREACFENLRQEIPYGLAVKVMNFDETGPIVKIQCEILVDKLSHKGIVIGAKGSMLKIVGSQARKEIERVMGVQVFLELHVHVTENWTQNPRILKELGYVVPKQ